MSEAMAFESEALKFRGSESSTGLLEQLLERSNSRTQVNALKVEKFQAFLKRSNALDQKHPDTEIQFIIR